MRSILLPALAVALALAGAGVAEAQVKPSVEEAKDKVVLSNADVTVWFQGKKPMLKIFPTGAEEDAGFEFRFTRVVEFRDADGDGVADADEVRAFLNLNPATGWEVETVTEEDRATLTLTLEAPLTLRGPAELDVDVPGERLMGNVTLTFHVFAETTEVATDNVTVPVTTTQVKYDLAVERWDWLDAENDRLALVGEVPADLVTEGEGVATVAANGTEVGLVAWLPTAEATTAGETETVDVVTEVTSEDGKATIQHAFAASGFDALLYDPIFGVASAEAEAEGALDVPSDLNPAPAAGLVAAVAVVGLAAGLRRSR